MENKDRDDKVFWYLTAASCAHVVEEYFWPGGFLESAKKIAPEAFEHASLPIIVGVNSSMVIGCTLGALMRKRSQVLGLSMASLLFLTGLALYVPLSVAAFKSYRRSPQYKRSTAVGAAVLGTVLHSTPFVSFAIRGALTKRSRMPEGTAADH